ncbi:MAG: IS21 family transposase [Clostridiales bacterium]|nr:IS21 family transposase [Clostridiales bacterium]
MTQFREILRLNSLGINNTDISKSLKCSRTTVRSVLKRASELDIKWPLPSDVTDTDLYKKFFQKSAAEKFKREPDVEHIYKELLKDGVSLKLLWNEYCEDCRVRNELPLMYSQFCEIYRKHAEVKRATMHILRKPGELIEVDWAGSTAKLVDRDTGEITSVYVFVAVLPFSQYAYVEAFPNMKQESWIAAHINMYNYVGGVSKILVPDNLKTGVIKADWRDPQLNRTYREMSEHYNTAIIPARVKKPKDKASVESTVGNISTWIIATLRNEKFFTLSELNKSIREKLNNFNSRPFQKREGSRISIFLGEEKSMLLPLPATPFELATWKQATVQINYHIQVEKMHYSVPHEYIKYVVDVRITKNVIEVFYNNHRLCSHPRLYGRPGQYSTMEEHMPEDHRKYLKWNSERFIAWAEKVGPSTTITIKSILNSYRIEEQGYKSCMGLLKLADKHSVGRLEAACSRALYYTPHPSYKSVKSILTSGQDKLTNEIRKHDEQDPATLGFTRGADYYGGKKYDE